MSGFTTPEQDRRFHAVADKFDRPTRRRVQRAVAKGEPPLDEDLRPLALLYLERQEKDTVASKRRIPRFWVGLGAATLVWAVFSWIGGSVGTGIGFTISGLGYVALGFIIARTQRNLAPRLQRSRQLLVGRTD